MSYLERSEINLLPKLQVTANFGILNLKNLKFAKSFIIDYTIVSIKTSLLLHVWISQLSLRFLGLASLFRRWICSKTNLVKQ